MSPVEIVGNPCARQEHENAKLRSLVVEYACHQAWRCEHQDRWPWEPDCMCGLTEALRELGFMPETAAQARVV